MNMNQVVIKSIADYFKEYGGRVGKGEPVAEVKADLVADFKREIQDQILFRTKCENVDDIPHTPQNEEIVVNIGKNAGKKWRSLVRLFNQYRETYHMINADDIVFDELDKTPPEEAPTPEETVE